jgi:bifunctional NMN adenylyltransferase/nudix hydrolase
MKKTNTTHQKVHVLICRAQIAHTAHLALFKSALQKCDHLIVLVGSSDLARDFKNPFTFVERQQVLQQLINPLLTANQACTILPLHDYVYSHNKWIAEVQHLVSSATTSTDITITGCDKDASTYYLKLFKHWKQDMQEKIGDINSTSIRDAYFGNGEILTENLPQETISFLERFKTTPEYALLVDEFNFVKNYQQQFSKMPYSIPFVTGDAIVVCAGHLLVIERKALPGKGLWALPGGFFQTGMKYNHETGKVEIVDKVDVNPIDAALRELKEETKIKVAPNTLLKNIVRTDIFADPNRSLRWRIITHAAHIQLKDTELPKIKGSDDARKAWWLPLGDIIKNRHMFFEDHLSIIDSFLGIL